jgi:hypothetical protein
MRMRASAELTSAPQRGASKTTFFCRRAGRRCLRSLCEPLRPRESWDLDHAERDGNGYLGPSHSSCNRAARRIRENGLAWSRRWDEDARESTVVAGKRDQAQRQVGAALMRATTPDWRAPLVAA